MAELKHTEDSSASGICKNCNNHIREKLVELLHDAFRRCWQTPCSKCDHFGTPEEKHCQLNLFADHLIDNNAELVVRCKDCAYWHKTFVNGKGFRICPASGMDITEDDFCSYGERRDSDG